MRSASCAAGASKQLCMSCGASSPPLQHPPPACICQIGAIGIRSGTCQVLVCSSLCIPVDCCGTDACKSQPSSVLRRRSCKPQAVARRSSTRHDAGTAPCAQNCCCDPAGCQHAPSCNRKSVRHPSARVPVRLQPLRTIPVPLCSPPVTDTSGTSMLTCKV